MTDETPAIRALHAIYESQTGLNNPLTMDKIFAWEAFRAAGHTAEDLRMVISALRAKIRRGQKTIGCFRFRWFIGNLEYFAEDLAEARALARVTKPTPKQTFLATVGRPAPEKDTAKPIRDILAENRALAELLRVRDSL